MFVQLGDQVLSLVDVEMYVGVGDSDLGMQERHIGGVAADGVEDNLLVLDVVCPSVGKRLIQ